MIIDGPHRLGGHKEAHVQGWTISLLLHGTLAFAAVLFVKQVNLTQQDEAFKWNVAMVSPTQQVPSTTTAPVPPTKRADSAQTPSAPQPLAQQTTLPVSERTATPVLTESSAPTPTPLTAPSLSAAHTTPQAEPVKHEDATPIVAESTSSMRQADAPTAGSREFDTQLAPSNLPSTPQGQPVQSDQVPVSEQMAAISPSPSNGPTKRDYGWLSEEILRRVEELKRYPTSARADRAEGKVVVKAVINEDGNLGLVEIFQSSGHLALDKAAVETMRQAAPFHLPHPLGQPRMTIKIPMSYRLDR